MTHIAIVDATNCHRGFAAKGQSLGSDFTSKVIDFRDMPMGCIEFIWSGASNAAGIFKIYASIIPEIEGFEGTEIDCSDIAIDAPTGSRIWIREVGL